jgi:hypothetical protein
MVQYAMENDLDYYNFLAVADKIGIDYSKDTYDGGLHLNLVGAEKFTDYFGKILSDTYDLPNRSQEEELGNIWDKKVKFYYDMEEDQQKELQEYGYLKSYGAQAQTIEEQSE